MEDKLFFLQKLKTSSFPSTNIIIPFEYEYNNFFKNRKLLCNNYNLLIKGLIESQQWEFCDIADKDNELYEHIEELILTKKQEESVENYVGDSVIGSSLRYVGQNDYLGFQNRSDKNDCKNAIHKRWLRVYVKGRLIGSFKIDWLKLVLFKHYIGFWIFNLTFDIFINGSEVENEIELELKKILKIHFLEMNKLLCHPFYFNNNSHINFQYDTILPEIPTNQISSFLPNSENLKDYIKVQFPNIDGLSFIKKSFLKNIVNKDVYEKANESTDEFIRVITLKDGKNILTCTTRFYFELFANSIIQDFRITSYFNNVHDKTLSCIRPKKLISFNYVFSEKKDSCHEDEILQTLLCLRKGHDSLKFSNFDQIEEANAVYRPFSDSYWGISREGIANIVFQNVDEGNNYFFKTHYLKNLNTYLYLYIIVLQQYYGLLLFSKDLSKLPGEMDLYLKGSQSTQRYNTIIKIYERANLFYMKNVFEEVTNITHQADFYRRIQKIYSIKPMMDELFYEISSVKDIIESKKIILDDKRRKLITSIGFVVVFWTILASITQVISETVYKKSDISLKSIGSFMNVLLTLLIMEKFWIITGMLILTSITVFILNAVFIFLRDLILCRKR